jgi:hypothetical protein
MQVIWVKREEKYFCNQRWLRHNLDATDLPDETEQELGFFQS